MKFLFLQINIKKDIMEGNICENILRFDGSEEDRKIKVEDVIRWQNKMLTKYEKLEPKHHILNFSQKIFRFLNKKQIDSEMLVFHYNKMEEKLKAWDSKKNSIWSFIS